MGLFNNLFSKRNLLEPLDLSTLRVDMHSHLIPGIDDGAPDLETSLALINGLHELGYRNLITTPHIMSDYYPNTPESIRGAFTKLKQTLLKQHSDVKIMAAAEYMIDTHFENWVKEEKELLTIFDKDILVEMPFAEAAPAFDEVVFTLQARGYRIVLAHPERYTYFHSKDLEKYHDLVDRNIMLQVNLNSFTGAYGPHVKQIAEQLVEAQLVRVLGTDTHHERHLDLAKTAVRNPFVHQLVQQENLLNHEWEKAFQTYEMKP